MLLVSVSLSTPLFSQKLAIDAYYVRVITKEGERFRGILEDVDDSYLYLSTESRIPLHSIRKVALRRKNKTSVLITGSLVGGLLVGYLAHQSLQKNGTRSAIAHGLTLTFAAAAGATGGLLVSSGINGITHKVVRPPDGTNAELYLARQLTPFSVTFQQNILNGLPKYPQ